ncbi:MAG: hypothetical protein ABII90_08525 [Bacteroidota bacterium]
MHLPFKKVFSSTSVILITSGWHRGCVERWVSLSFFGYLQEGKERAGVRCKFAICTQSVKKHFAQDGNDNV